jgi:sugar phosphate isomerase/epimerase
MKIGMCSELMNAPLVAGAGFDYIESATSALALASEGDFREMAKAVFRSGIVAEAFNVMLPGKFHLTGPAADLDPVREYLELGFRRMAELAAVIQVFGSGGARNVPEGWPMERAAEQLVGFLNLAAPLEAKHDIFIPIEPLNPGECNIINTVEDARALAEMAGLPNIGVLADWYHMAKQQESPAGILAAGKTLLHCHLANPEGRRFPLPGDGADYSAFFGSLRQIGYTGRVSVEAGGTQDEYSACLRRIRECA